MNMTERTQLARWINFFFCWFYHTSACELSHMSASYFLLNPDMSKLTRTISVIWFLLVWTPRPTLNLLSPTHLDPKTHSELVVPHSSGPQDPLWTCCAPLIWTRNSELVSLDPQTHSELVVPPDPLWTCYDFLFLRLVRTYKLCSTWS